ncbi:MAG: hypothetical protein ABII18_09555 [bacterium]
MFFDDKLKTCPKCKQLIVKKRFYNTTLHLADNFYLIEVHDKIGRVVGCLNCLDEFICTKANKFEDRAEYPNRYIYLFNQTPTEKMQRAIFRVVHFFQKRKGQNDQQTGN